MKILPFINYNIGGLLLIAFISTISIYISHLGFFQQNKISPIIISVILGAAMSPIYLKKHDFFSHGVAFSAKRILRIGIIFYGFNVTLHAIFSVGIIGLVASVFSVVVIFILALILGHIFKLDKQTSMLVGIGSAVCGAAAVLALEGVIKSESYKGVIAVSTVVIFGLLSMFLYPIAYNNGLIPLNLEQMGIYIGASIHEVAHVVGASASISEDVQNSAVITKMIRVIMLVPLLLFISFFISRKNEGSKGSISIPYFAFAFLGVIVLNSIISINEVYLKALQEFSSICLVFAMSALGVMIDFKKFFKSGGKAFLIALILWVVLIFGGYFLVALLYRIF